MTQTQEQLIRSIEQQLENLSFFDNDLACQYEYDLYYVDENDEPTDPIVELFTPELLEELIQTVNELDV